MSNTSFGASYDQSQVEDRPTGLPDGDYPFQLVEAERKASAKNAANWYIEAKFKVMAGPFADQKHIERYNIGHTTDTVKKGALADIKSLSQAVGYTGPLSSMDPYFGKPFCGTIKVTKKVDPEKGEQVNHQIRKYQPIAAYSAAPSVGGSAPITVAPLVTTAPQSAAPAGTPGPAPWGAQPAAA